MLAANLQPEAGQELDSRQKYCLSATWTEGSLNHRNTGVGSPLKSVDQLFYYPNASWNYPFYEQTFTEVMSLPLHGELPRGAPKVQCTTVQEYRRPVYSWGTEVSTRQVHKLKLSGWGQRSWSWPDLYCRGLECISYEGIQLSGSQPAPIALENAGFWNFSFLGTDSVIFSYKNNSIQAHRTFQEQEKTT